MEAPRIAYGWTCRNWSRSSKRLRGISRGAHGSSGQLELEADASCQLHGAGRAGRGDLTESRTAQSESRDVEIGSVQQIVGFGTKVELDLLGDSEILFQGGVGVEERWSA